MTAKNVRKQAIMSDLFSLVLAVRFPQALIEVEISAFNLTHF